MNRKAQGLFSSGIIIGLVVLVVATAIGAIVLGNVRDAAVVRTTVNESTSIEAQINSTGGLAQRATINISVGNDRSLGNGTFVTWRTNNTNLSVVTGSTNLTICTSCGNISIARFDNFNASQMTDNNTIEFHYNITTQNSTVTGIADAGGRALQNYAQLFVVLGIILALALVLYFVFQLGQ